MYTVHVLICRLGPIARMRALLIWLAAVLLAAGARGRQGPRCQVEQKVKFILLTMNKNTVRAVVDCVVSPDRIELGAATPWDGISRGSP